MAIAPHAQLVDAKDVESRSKASIVLFHDAPASSERQTPPSAVAM